ncbi:MAG TPA: hypothetical protein VIX14_07435 [Terriglobales bacterium]
MIEQFECDLPSSYGHHSSGEAGRDFVTHNAGFESFFAMRSEKWTPLMPALHDDVSAQLTENGAQILSRGDPGSGFHFDYKLGKSIGTLTISPWAITPRSSIHRGAELPADTVDVNGEFRQPRSGSPRSRGQSKWAPGIRIGSAGLTST